MTQGEQPHASNGGVVSHLGRTREGQPLAFNHSPTPALAPWFSWFSVTSAELPDGIELADGILNDTACIRLVYGGRWRIETRDGPVDVEPGAAGRALHFGPQSRIMPVRFSGRFKVITVQLAAGAAVAMGGPDQSSLVDRVLDHDALVGHGRLAGRIDPDDPDPRNWVAAVERELRKFVTDNPILPPNPLIGDFESCALADPAMAVTTFAARHRVTSRTVERLVREAYGLTPKQVLRRARALDIAAALLGVAMEDEEAELRLRYFDQSHLNREVRAFFGTTPRDLRAGQHPLLRLNLETRQARRLEMLERLPEGAMHPWRDPAAEPPAL